MNLRPCERTGYRTCVSYLSVQERQVGCDGDVVVQSVSGVLELTSELAANDEKPECDKRRKREQLTTK